MTSYCKQGGLWARFLHPVFIDKQWVTDFQFPAGSLLREWELHVRMRMSLRAGKRAWTSTLHVHTGLLCSHMTSRAPDVHGTHKNVYAWVLQAEITRLLLLFTNPSAVDKCLLWYRIPIGGRQNRSNFAFIDFLEETLNATSPLNPSTSRRRVYWLW